MSESKKEEICRVCGQQCTHLFVKQILGKHAVSYYQCGGCQFVQTEEPFWLEEAYEEAISALDVGLVRRNLTLQKVVARFISEVPGLSNGPFLDYGAGTGLLVRLMRDEGFDFKYFDTYAKNQFALGFEAEPGQKFNLITAFEVFEHLADPRAELEKMLNWGDNILFSTEITPDSNLENWDYLMPEAGQHVAFFTLRALETLASEQGLTFASNGRNLHFLGKGPLDEKTFNTVTSMKPSLLTRVLNRLKPGSEPGYEYIQKDFQYLLELQRNKPGG